MLQVEWNTTDGWLAPRIVPYQNLSLDPAMCVFHYGLECFEGMKAYKSKEGDIRLFRPYSNIDRLNKSAARIAFPTIEPDSFVSLLSTFVNMEQRFIPT